MAKPIVINGIDQADRKALEVEARKIGLPLSAYCRMLLLQTLNKGEKG